MHLIGWLSLHCLVFSFLELWSGLSFGPFFFFLSQCTGYVKGRSLRCSPGQGNAGQSFVTLYVGEGSDREQWRLLHSLTDFSHCPCYPHQIGPFWCWFPSGWACACSKPLWVSPMISPVRLGVSPAAASTPTGVFNQRFEALFPGARAQGCTVCFAPLLFLRVIYARMWGRGVC